jgi:membrane protease YdiL (CAAX protease family)
LETTISAAVPPGPGVGPKPWGILAILAGLIVPLALLIPNLFLETPDDLSRGDIVFSLIATLALKDVLFIGTAAGFAIWRYRLGWDSLGLRPFERSQWWVPIIAAVGALAAIMAYSALLIAVGAEDATPQQEDLDDLLGDNAVLPLAGFAIVIAAPISEEIFFRGFIFAGLIRPLGVAGAMVVSGLLFGAFHITGVSSLGVVLPFSVIGAGLAWLYYRTGSLWLCIGTHFLFNVVGFTGGVLSS